MTGLLLVFLGAAYLENLLLRIFFDGGGVRAASGISGKWLIVAGSLLILALVMHGFPTAVPAIPPQAAVYLQSLAFVATAMAAAPLADGPIPGPGVPRLQSLRQAMPLLVANFAVLTFVLLDGRQSPSLREALGLSLGASLPFLLITLFAPPMLERIEGAAVPPIWKGLPIVALTACLVALALTGYRGALSW